MNRVPIPFLLASLLAPFACTSRPPEAHVEPRSNPAVVSVRTSQGKGTGFVVRQDGWIATNFHLLLSDPSRAVVTFDDHRAYDVLEVVAADRSHDLAIVRIDAKALPVLPLGDSSTAHPGEPVVALASPLSVEHAVSNGLVAALRPLPSEHDALIQVSAPISPSSAGAPLLNGHGQVIGVESTSVPGGESLNVAIPSNWLRNLLGTPRPMSLAAFAAANDARPEHECSLDSPEDCDVQCSRGDTASCANLAYLLQVGRGVTQDFSRSLHVAVEACSRGEARGCTYLGYLYERGEGVDVDLGRASELYGQACEAGDAAGCSSLATLYQQRTGAAGSSRATQLRDRACNAGRAWDCTELALHYEKAHSYAKAMPLYKRGCDGGDGAACMGLGKAYALGHGTARDAELALLAFKRACDRGSREGCAEYGARLVEDSRMPTDRERGVSLLHEACKRGILRSCDKLRELKEKL